MEKKFIQFLFTFLQEMGVDPNAVVGAFAEQQGFKNLRQERDLRDNLVQKFGIPVTAVTGRTVQQLEAEAPAAGRGIGREAEPKQEE